MIRTTRIATPRGIFTCAYRTSANSIAALAARNGWRLAVSHGRVAMVEAPTP
ncbi:hypothetical protein ACUN8C_05750 [Kushneria sp. Sum13]|uniref:hypothetical protein n=1 Tax=Kushneria sp. Sum13 TaxID=3459196 RepID=UPI0040460E9E